MRLLLRRHLTLIVLLSSAAACHKQNSPGIQVDPDEAKFIPPQTKALAGVQLAALQAAPLYQRHANLLDIPLAQGAATSIGLDPRRDLKSVVVTLAGDQALAILSGTFSKAAVQQKLSGNGAHSGKYANQTVLSSDSGAVSFPRDGVAIAGPLSSVRRALDAAQDRTHGIPPSLQPRLQLLPADDQIWFVSDGPLPIQQLSRASGMASTLSSLAGFVQSSSVGLHVDSGLHLTANLACVSEKGAQQVRDALKGLVGLARLTTKDGDMDLLRAYDAIQISQDKQVVRLQADVTPELSDKLLTRLPELRGSIGNFSR